MIRNRGLAASLAAVAVVAASSAVFAAPAPRVESASYMGGTPPGLNVNWQLADKGIGGVVLPGGTERFVSVEVVDDSTLPVSIAVTQDTSGDGVPEIRHEACGATGKPVKVEANKDIVVFVFQGPCGSGTPALATSGTVTATFTKGRAL